MKSKFGNFLLALMVAFCLWAYVITTVSPGSEETFYNVPVAREGETVLQERGLMITGVSSTNVNLTLSGTRQDLAKVNSGNITLKVDLSKIYEPGTHSLRYSVGFPGDVANDALVVENRYPEGIVFQVEEKRTKEVDVEVRWIGSAPEGYMTDREDRVLDYPTVTVSGPASVADLIEGAVIEVDLTERTESISESYRYTLVDAEGNPVDAQLITTNVQEVRLDVKIQRFKDLRLSYHLISGGGASANNANIRFSVDTIRVSGSDALLEDLGDELVVATIDLGTIARNTELTCPINLPEGVTNLSGISETTITIQLIGLLTKSFALNEFLIVNVPEGMEAEIITQELKVEIRGASALVQMLSEEDIVATVDFAGAEAGSNNFRVTITFSDPALKGLGTVGSYSVYATVKAAE